MPKLFSDYEKEQHRITLFNDGLRMIMEHGYKNVTVEKLTQLIGSSKGYFYLLFESKEDFYLKAIRWQMEQILNQLMSAREKGASHDEISRLYKDLFLQASHANFVDVFYIQNKITREQWEQFRAFEELHFSKAIQMLGKDPNVCNPRVLSNLSAVVFLSYGMSHDSPYLFADKNEETLEVLLNMLHRYVVEH